MSSRVPRLRRIRPPTRRSGAIEDIARQIGARIASLRHDSAGLDVTLVGERPIDARVLRIFERSDVFGAPRIAASDDGRAAADADYPAAHNIASCSGPTPTAAIF